MNDKTPLPGKTHYAYKKDLDDEVKASVAKGAQSNGGKLPQIFIMGYLGRCGTGAREMCETAGIPSQNLIKYDIPETKDQPGPYSAIKESDIFINCIYLDKPIPPFVTVGFLKQDNGVKRNLSTVVDISCDTTNPHNPIPFCDTPTSFTHPTITVPGFSNPPLSYCTIDHLPSLLPREASEKFCADLAPFLQQLPQRNEAPVWMGAKNLFEKNVEKLPEANRAKKGSGMNGHVPG